MYIKEVVLSDYKGILFGRVLRNIPGMILKKEKKIPPRIVCSTTRTLLIMEVFIKFHLDMNRAIISSLRICSLICSL